MMKRNLIYAMLVLLPLAAASQAPGQGASQSSIVVKGSKGLPFIAIDGGKEYQAAELTLTNGGDSAQVTVRIAGMTDQVVGVGHGDRTVEIRVPEVVGDSTVDVTLAWGAATGGVATGKAADARIALRPVRKMTIYILPHSHNDIGYTEIQTNVEKKQLNNLLTGIDYAQRTKDYPAGARFVWNLEGLYAADLYLHRMDEGQKNAFFAAVRDGGVALNGMYLNTLTGLCRPEELLQLFHYSTGLSQQCGVTTDAAMISDVPGYTWGTVAAMAQAGIKYFSAAPNNFDRIGDILEQWEDKPFYWVSPSGKEKVLVWIPYRGYSLSHGMPEGLSSHFVVSYLDKLHEKGFPYDISYIRWSGHGDNAVPDMTICDFVKDWSSKYAWPKFIISSTSTAFRAFEQRYGDRLPQEHGDWTGYWEDGAASSAYETAENRASSSRLSQAEALWAMKGAARAATGGAGMAAAGAAGAAYPVDSFAAAWQHVILYSEHTWGADESVTRPLSQKTKEQWAIKKGYATEADSLSRALVRGAVGGGGMGGDAGGGGAGAVDVYNTHSWERTGLVVIAGQGDGIKDEAGHMIASQRLSTGELAFVAERVPAFSARRYYVVKGKVRDPAKGARTVGVGENWLDNGIVRVVVDEKTGAIKSLRARAIDNDFVDSASGEYLNDYLYLQGNKLADLQRNGPVRIVVKEKGPVVSVLEVSSEAPGCNKLTRELRLVKGFDYVELTDILDKKPATLNPHPGDYKWANTEGKESVNIGFPFHVDGGAMQLDIPMALMRPELDQLPGSCKNWLEVGNYADVSNATTGITWVTLDAPLVEVGGITAILLGGQSHPEVWRKKIEPTQKLYSWAINNHWETNYRAYQDGIITFRYALRPHGAFDALAATQFSAGLTQPLIVAPAAGLTDTVPMLKLTGGVVVLALRPSADGKAWIVTLFNPGTEAATTRLQWSVPVHGVFYSNTGEAVLAAVADGVVQVAARDVVTVRVER
jgi:alpha-mannosidase